MGRTRRETRIRRGITESMGMAMNMMRRVGIWVRGRGWERMQGSGPAPLLLVRERLQGVSQQVMARGRLRYKDMGTDTTGTSRPPRVRSLFSSKGMRVTVRSSILLSRSMASRRNSNRDMMLPILVSLMQQVPDESESG